MPRSSFGRGEMAIRTTIAPRKAQGQSSFGSPNLLRKRQILSRGFCAVACGYRMTLEAQETGNARYYRRVECGLP
jgi:hypothetical protein